MKHRLLSWNVNGLRACGGKGFVDWFGAQSADVVCLQEIKATPAQLTPELLNPGKYHGFWHPAEKPGYGGVAMFTRREPLAIRYGLGDAKFDREGRVITAEFKNYTVINSYFPNSRRDHARLDFKMAFCQRFAQFVREEERRGKTLILCADWNIAPTELDLKNANANKNNAGFLPAERAWMAEFLESGYVDGFRHFTPDPGHYTWWSNRPGVRERNVGWRLDYFLVSLEAKTRLKASAHQHHILGSDHCPVLLEVQS